MLTAALIRLRKRVGRPLRRKPPLDAVEESGGGGVRKCASRGYDFATDIGEIP